LITNIITTLKIHSYAQEIKKERKKERKEKEEERSIRMIITD